MSFEWPEHPDRDEYLRRTRDLDAGLQNLAAIVFARLNVIEQHLGIDSAEWEKVAREHSVVPDGR